MDEFTTEELVQLFKLLDKFPPSGGGIAQSYLTSINDVWELVLGELFCRGVDPQQS